MGRLFESGRRRRTDGPKPGHVPANPPSERAARGLRTRRMAQTQGGQTFGGKASPLLVADGVTLQYKTTDHLVTATWRVSASSAAKGSSISSTAGSMASARAIATRCFMPPDSMCG